MNSPTLDPQSPRPDTRRGFVLPAALLALTVLTVVTTAGFFSVQQEAKIGAASGQATEAFYLAEMGVNSVLDRWSATPLTNVPQWGSWVVSDTTSLGIWRVTVTKGNDQMFYLDSEGTVTTGGLLTRGATRRVGLAARITLPDFSPRAAATTTVSTSVAGTVEIHGEDRVPVGWGSVCSGALTDKSGVLMQDTSALGSSGPANITGNPPMAEDPFLGPNSLTQFGDLDWADLIGVASKKYSPGTLPKALPKISGNGGCDVAHPANWGDPEHPAAPCGNLFPVIYIAGDAVLQSGTRGQGILLVEGDLIAQGDFLFNGMVVAQGSYTATGTANHVVGALMASQVNLSAGSSVGSSNIDYSSCAVHQAVVGSADLNRARPLNQRGWVDVSVLGGGGN